MHHLLGSSFKESVGVHTCIIHDFECTFVFVIVGHKMKYSGGGGSHSVGMDVALNVVVEIIGGQCTGVTK
jgi:hypothetical protein